MSTGFSHANRNGLWNRVLVDALLAAGLRRVVLCPGGRNGLLAMTLDRTPAMSCLQHVDERSGAFLALGQAQADGMPAAICTTSGSAVANLLPALSEADARNLPLLLLTCDRPQAGRGRREPQTLPQSAICAPLLRAQLELPDPFDGRLDLDALQAEVSRTLARAWRGELPGPVQINVPQWGAYCATEADPAPAGPLPQAPTPGPADTETSASTVFSGRQQVMQAMAAVGARPGLRGLIVAGPDQPLSCEAVAELARASGYPLMADVGSGLRQSGLPGLVTTADALMMSPLLETGRTELLIRLGDAPVSPGVQRSLRALACPTLLIAGHRPGPDFLSPGALGLHPPDGSGLEALGECLHQGDEAWAALWRDADEVAVIGRCRFLAGAPWGEVAAAARVCAAPGFGAMHLANSLSIRHAGLLMPARSDAPRIFCARGVNGTDGTLGLILGEMLATGVPMLALIGDQAFTHDLPALANPAWREGRGALCVMNNGGAGLFDLVPCSRVPDYAATMRNPPAIDFAGIARAFGLQHRPCENVEGLDAALDEAAQASAMLLIEIRVPPGTAARDLPPLVRSMLF